MQLGFNIQVREDKEYLLSEEDSKKVIDKVYELAKKKQCNIDDNPNCLSSFVKCAIQLLLDSGEIEGALSYKNTEEELTCVWEA